MPPSQESCDVGAIPCEGEPIWSQDPVSGVGSPRLQAHEHLSSEPPRFTTTPSCLPKDGETWKSEVATLENGNPSLGTESVSGIKQPAS